MPPRQSIGLTATGVHTAFRSVLLGLLFMLALTPWRGLVSAQDATPRYAVAVRGVPLQEALQLVVDVTRADLAWDPLLVSGKRSFCVIEDAQFEALLSCVLEGTGLDFVRRSTGLYVLEVASEGPPVYGNLRGIVLDADSEQPIPNAHIYLADAGRGDVANHEGMFIFPRLLPGTYRMRVSHMGYRHQTLDVSVRAGGISSTEVILESESYLIAPIIIDGLSSTPSSSMMGSAVANQEQIASDLSGSNASVLQTLSAMPGVRINDATSDIHIQGGEAGEHKFRLDGATLFIPLNVATFVGPFSPFALGRLTVHKAGFGAGLGSQISGIIEAEHDLRVPTAPDGIRGGSQFTVQVDPLATNARYSHSFRTRSGRHVTLLGAGRAGMWQLLSPPSLSGLLDSWNVVDTFLLSAFAEQNTPFANLPPEGNPSLAFTDIHMAGRIRLSTLRTLGTSLYWGRSSIGNALSDIDLTQNEPLTLPEQTARFKDLYSWQNGMVQARYDVVRSAHVLAHAQVRGSFYVLDHDFRSPASVHSEEGADDGNSVYELSAVAGADYFSDSGHRLETGIEWAMTRTDFTVAGTQNLPLRHASTGVRLATFLTDVVQIGQNGSLEVGTRFTWLHSRRSLYAEPRLSTRFDFTETPIGGLSFFVGGGLYRQFVNQFDVSSRSPRAFVSSTRFWMQNDASVTPPKAAHVAAEVLVLPNPRWSLSGEVYYKRHYHILGIDYSADPGSGKRLDQSEFLAASNGTSRGLGIGVKRMIGPGNVHFGVDLSRAERTIAGQFGNAAVTVPWNEPIRIELGADLVPFPRTVVAVRWKSVLDRAWGFRKSYYDFLSAHLNDLDAIVADMRANGVSEDAIRRVERQIVHYDLMRPDQHVLPALHQLDVSAAYTFRQQDWALQLRMDIMNVLNRDNAAEWQFRLDEDRYFNGGVNGLTGLLDRSDRPLLPRVLSVAARVTW
jgi:hypothetical protein